MQFQFIQYFLRRQINMFRKQLMQGLTKLLDFHCFHQFTCANSKQRDENDNQREWGTAPLVLAGFIARVFLLSLYNKSR